MKSQIMFLKYAEIQLCIFFDFCKLTKTYLHCVSVAFQKKNRREHIPAYPARSTIPSVHQQEQRDPGVSINLPNGESDKSAYSASIEETLLSKSTDPTG